MKRRHHFVPQFYLRGFQSAPKRIHLLNLDRGTFVPSVSIRDQCYRRRLHGKTDDLEDALAAVEGVAATALRNVCATGAPPHAGSEGYQHLASAVALQYVRTIVARDRTRALLEQMASAAFGPAVPADYQTSAEEALLFSLGALRPVSAAIAQLRVLVIRAAPGNCFITSDNPVFRYNQYCAGVTWVGVLGIGSPGIQVGMAVSPDYFVLFADPRVYKLGRSAGATSYVATAQDVDVLNRLQLLSAESNVYFSDWDARRNIEQLLALGRRPLTVARTNVADEEGSVGSSLIHQYEVMTDLHVRLSFVSVRRQARRVPLDQRARIGRVERRAEQHKEPSDAAPVARRFIVRRGAE